jgi:hypothetical protein
MEIEDYEYNDKFSIFDDKGAVKNLVNALVHVGNPGVAIYRMRKFEYSYLFTLTRGTRSEELEVSREEIDASSRWRKGAISPSLHKKVLSAVNRLK